MKNHRSLFLIGLLGAALAAPFARAITFTLDASTATIISGVSNSPFFKIETGTPDNVTGTAAGVFTYAISGTGAVPSSPYQIEIFFNGPQPFLTSAAFKGGTNHMFWDSADLVGFNAGIYTSITLVGNGLLNPNGNSYIELSHATLTSGVRPPNSGGVPDGGSTALLLGLGLVTLAVAARRRS